MTEQRITLYGQWYVYSHSIGERLVYIGKGCRGRAFDMHNRTRTHKALCNRQQLTVAFLAWFDSEDKAKSHEARLIASLTPVCNLSLPYVRARRDGKHPKRLDAAMRKAAGQTREAVTLPDLTAANRRAQRSDWHRQRAI